MNGPSRTTRRASTAACRATILAAALGAAGCATDEPGPPEPFGPCNCDCGCELEGVYPDGGLYTITCGLVIDCQHAPYLCESDADCAIHCRKQCHLQRPVDMIDCKVGPSFVDVASATLICGGDAG